MGAISHQGRTPASGSRRPQSRRFSRRQNAEFQDDFSEQREQEGRFGRQAPLAKRRAISGTKVLNNSGFQNTALGAPIRVGSQQQTLLTPVQLGVPQFGASTIGDPVQFGAPQAMPPQQLDLGQLLQLPRQQILSVMKSDPRIAQQMLAVLQSAIGVM